jgi:hypothetical protein
MGGDEIKEERGGDGHVSNIKPLSYLETRKHTFFYGGRE